MALVLSFTARLSGFAWAAAVLGGVAAAASACGSDEPVGGPNHAGVGGNSGAANGAAAGEGGSAAGGSAAGGSSAGRPADGGAAGGGGEAELPGAIVFADDHELEYHLTIAAADVQHLEERGNDEAYVPASLVVRGGRVGELDLGVVGVRHKGAYSLHHCWDDFGGTRSYEGTCAKLSYKLDFTEYVEDTRFFRLKKLNLHAGSGDSTKLRELLAYGMFREFGVGAPRVAPAGVYINGSYAGVFLAVENIDGRYTAFHYPEGGDGNLYKEIWPRAGLPDAHFSQALETNEEIADVSDMQGFAAAVGAATAETFERDLAEWVDLEALLRYIAVDRASKNWDGIMSFYSPFTSHNFYWYRDDGPAPRFHLIPWDLDNTFWEFDPYMAPEQWATAEPVPDFNVRPAHCDPRPIWSPDSGESITPPGCDPLLALLASTQWERFAELGQGLLAGPFRLEAMEPKLTAWEARLAPLVRDDPTLNEAEWRSDTAEFRSILKRDIADFASFLAEGYREEVVVEPPPEPTEEELAAPLVESGLRLDVVNNYEFEGGAAEVAPADTSSSAEAGTTTRILWNTTEPLAGGADLHFGFVFARTPGAWDEWATLALGTAGWAAVDISAYQQISITVRSDRARRVRIRLSSPAYDDVYGGIWAEFGSDFEVGTTTKTLKLRLASVSYPSWASAVWQPGQGFESASEARATILRRFNGLLFAPAPSTDSAGEMLAESEEGFLRIDNIYFQ